MGEVARVYIRGLPGDVNPEVLAAAVEQVGAAGESAIDLVQAEGANVLSALEGAETLSVQAVQQAATTATSTSVTQITQTRDAALGQVASSVDASILANPTVAGLEERTGELEGAVTPIYVQNIEVERVHSFVNELPDGSEQEMGFTDTEGVLEWLGALRSASVQTGVATLGDTDLYGYETLEPGDLIFADEGGHIVSVVAAGEDPGGSSSEVVSARGSRPLLGDRLSVVLDPYGHEKVPNWGLERLRQTRWKLRNLSIGGKISHTGTLPVVFNAALVGDSYTYGPEWSDPFTRALRKDFGDASGGFINFRATGPVAFSAFGEVGTTTAGAWTDTASAVTTPDRSYIRSTTVGDKVTVTTVVAKSLTLMRLYYSPTADGLVRYRWNGGAWTDLSVAAGSGLSASADLAGLPGAAAIWTLEVEVVSGDVRLAGAYHAYAGTGVRVNKVAQNGSAASQWGGSNATGTAEWQAHIAAMGIDMFTIMLGANDQPTVPVPTFTSRIQGIAQNCKAACPAADVLVIMQPENQLGRTTKMADMAAAVRTMCVEQKLPFLDLQGVFGDAPTEYAPGAPHDWMQDGIHPTRMTGGGFVVADAVYRAITQGF